MKFIQELYEIQEQQQINECVIVLESAADILTFSSMGFSRGDDPLSFKVVSSLANKEVTGIDTLAAIYAGVEAIIMKASAQPDKAKQTILNIVNQAEFKTNNPFTAKLVELGHKQDKFQAKWKDELSKIHSTYTALKSNPKDTEAKAEFIRLSKEAEKKVKELHLKLSRTVKAISDELKTSNTASSDSVKLP